MWVSQLLMRICLVGQRMTSFVWDPGALYQEIKEISNKTALAADE